MAPAGGAALSVVDAGGWALLDASELTTCDGKAKRTAGADPAPRWKSFPETDPVRLKLARQRTRMDELAGGQVVEFLRG